MVARCSSKSVVCGGLSLLIVWFLHAFAPRSPARAGGASVPVDETNQTGVFPAEVPLRSSAGFKAEPGFR